MPLCLFDLDGTLTSDRTLDRLVRHVGVEVPPRRAGEPAGSVRETREILRLFAGLPATEFAERCRAATLAPGATETARRLHDAGFDMGIVTASYLHAARPLADRLGMRHVVAVEPVVVDGRIVGDATGLPFEGACGRAVCKEQVLGVLQKRVGAEWTCAVGDGPNDACMFKAADLGIAVGDAHPDARAAADHVVAGLDDACDLILRAWQQTRSGHSRPTRLLHRADMPVDR